MPTNINAVPNLVCQLCDDIIPLARKHTAQPVPDRVQVRQTRAPHWEQQIRTGARRRRLIPENAVGIATLATAAATAAVKVIDTHERPSVVVAVAAVSASSAAVSKVLGGQKGRGVEVRHCGELVLNLADLIPTKGEIRVFYAKVKLGSIQ